jgi:hypothetical protein
MKTTFDVFLIVDSDTYYAVGSDLDDAMEHYRDKVGGNGPLRVVRITALVTPPQIEDAEVDVADSFGELIKAEAAE